MTYSNCCVKVLIKLNQFKKIIALKKKKKNGNNEIIINVIAMPKNKNCVHR